MIFPDIVSWKNMREYDMGYPIKYITPFRLVTINRLEAKALFNSL